MDKLKELTYALKIPKEMFWGYEVVRKSGLYNMFCSRIPMSGNSSNDHFEMIKLIDDCYMRYCVYTNANINKPEYKHVTNGHIGLIQLYYNILSESYGLPPEGICNIKKETRITI